MAVVEGADHRYDPDRWDTDCGGKWSSCSITPLLYTEEGEEPNPTSPEPQKPILADAEIEDFNPFSNDDNDSDEEEAYEKAPEDDPRIPKKKPETAAEKAAGVSPARAVSAAGKAASAAARTGTTDVMSTPPGAGAAD